MPIYEYRCADCKKKVAVFFRSFAAVDQEPAHCPICQGTHLTKMVSKVRVIRGASSSSGGDDGFDDSMLDDLDENDPRSLGRMMRRMADETGEDMGPEFGEVVNRLEKGEDPEAIEKSMPELAEMGGPMGGDDGGGLGASMMGDEL
jgi:putative FmdB family regulatory protein